MRIVPLLVLGQVLLLAQGGFETEIRPLLQRYCLGCHSTTAHAGDLDLQRFRVFGDIVKDPRPWLKVVEQLSLGEMPPKVVTQPSAAERARLIEWTNGALRSAARERAGDPGPVVLRRLNNAEYTFTVRDLTGVDSLEPAKEFPADGAAGEGFLNTGNALAMSPSMVSKYLDAGKGIANHAVLLPDGIRFSKSTSRADWTNEILTEIRAFYDQHSAVGGVDNVTQQGVALDRNRGGVLPLRQYLEASRGTGTPKGLSPKYLGMLKGLMQGGRPSPLLDGLRAHWRSGTQADLDAMVAEIEKWQNTLWKYSSVGHIGKADGPKAWLEPVTPVVAQQEFRVKLTSPVVYLAAHDAGDGNAGDVVLWKEPKLVMAGRAPVLVRDLPVFVAQLTARRKVVLAETEAALTGRAAGAWTEYLAGAMAPVDVLTKKIEKVADFGFVKGWGSTSGPMVIANHSDQEVRVPGRMKARGAAVHPSPTLAAAVGWRSPVEGLARVEGTLQRVHAECGNGVTWQLELRRGGVRLRLADGELRNAAALALGPFEKLPVRKGDLLSVVVGPRDGNHSCDLTAVDLKVGVAEGTWSLAADMTGGGAQLKDWTFYSEPATGTLNGTVLPKGSVLARWMMEPEAAARARMAGELHRLVNGAAAPAGADGELYRQITSLASPLYAGSFGEARVAPDMAWGLVGAKFDGPSVTVKAPAVVEIRMPADLAANSELVTTGMLAPGAGVEGSVQLEVLNDKPEPRKGMLAAGTRTANGQGMWTSNNQTVTYSMPVVVNDGSAARKRVEAVFAEFRDMFPASLCYTKIVPVDEVVTLTLYHREDDHLRRLVLNERETAKLNRLWDELHYVSRDALTLVDAFEQLWQYATQDADPSKFEPLRQPIQARAAAFRKLLTESEPRHVEAVVGLAGRAYRRPVTEAEKAQLRGFYRELRGQGMGHEESLRLLIARVLVAPAFLYRAENAGPGKTAVPVGDYELASRLSYFLWSSMPDAELLAAAGAGKLRTEAGLRAQVKRMLADGRVKRLASEFGAAWLHLQGFESLDEKSERHFPTFRELRAPMYEETLRFFEDLFRRNGSVLSIVDADFTFLNEALAKHYEIPGVTGSEWRRVEGVKRYGRGGVLGQAAVLAKQSGASRTSPILRGSWIVEVMLGDKLPKPPKDVPPLPGEDAQANLTVREMTEMHTKDTRCASCHVRIDPYGYTMEAYDAIGRWRQKDAEGRAIRDAATLKDGTAVAGWAGMREYILTKGQAAFLRQFCRKLLGYSLGRAVQLSDEPLLEEMQTKLSANGYHVGEAVDLIVGSRQFREIRGRNYEQDQE